MMEILIVLCWLPCDVCGFVFSTVGQKGVCVLRFPLVLFGASCEIACAERVCDSVVERNKNLGTVLLSVRCSVTVFWEIFFQVKTPYIMTTPTGIPDKLWQPSYTVLETTMGEIVIELYWKHAAKTCRNFAELARRGYYNGTKFHRIIRDFMIQGGDPTGTGKGGASIYGRNFDDEIHEELKHTGAGILSMANSGPNTNGSQFFITLAPTQWLDGKHTIFGRVHSGMNVVKRIGLVETDKNDRPVDDVKIIRGFVRSH